METVANGQRQSSLCPSRLLSEGQWIPGVVRLEVFQFWLCACRHRGVMAKKSIDCLTVLALCMCQCPDPKGIGRRRYRYMSYCRAMTLCGCQSWFHWLFEAVVYCFCVYVWCKNLTFGRYTVKKGEWIWGERRKKWLKQNPQGRTRTCKGRSCFPSCQLQCGLSC